MKSATLCSECINSREAVTYKSPSAQSKCKRKTIYSIYCITLDVLCACLHVCCESDVQKITLSYGSTRASGIMNDEAEFSQFLLDIFFFCLTLLAFIGHRGYCCRCCCCCCCFFPRRSSFEPAFSLTNNTVPATTCLHRRHFFPPYELVIGSIT